MYYECPNCTTIHTAPSEVTCPGCGHDGCARCMPEGFCDWCDDEPEFDPFDDDDQDED